MHVHCAQPRAVSPLATQTTLQATGCPSIVMSNRCTALLRWCTFHLGAEHVYSSYKLRTIQKQRRGACQGLQFMR